MIEEKSLPSVTDPIFGKVRPEKTEAEAALDAAHEAMFGEERGRVRRWANDQAEHTNALGLESTATHTRIAKIWQERGCKPLPDLLDAERVLAERKYDERDYPVRDLHVAIKAQSRDLYLSRGQGGGRQITRRGMETLADFIGVPEAYVSKLINWGEDELAVRNVNRLVDRRVERFEGDDLTCTARFLRPGEGQAGESDSLRCVASKNYGILNNVDALEIVAEALGEGHILSSYTSKSTDTLTTTLFPEDRMVSMRNDSDYGIGMVVRNSEGLQTAFSAQPFLYRAICLNGCIWGKREGTTVFLMQRHVGQIDRKKMVEDVRTYFQAAMGQSEALLKLLDLNHEAKVTLPEAVIAHLCKANDLTREQGKAWHAAWMKEPEKTGFGIVNGLTLAAQAFGEEKRIAMETLAGDLIAPSLSADLAAIESRWDTIDRVAKQLMQESPKSVAQYALVGW